MLGKCGPVEPALIDQVDDDGRTALFHAATSDHVAVISALLRAGANPAARANYSPALRRLSLGADAVKVSTERVQAKDLTGSFGQLDDSHHVCFGRQLYTSPCPSQRDLCERSGSANAG